MLGLPFWQLAHGFSLLSSCLLGITGFVGFALTGMLLDHNGGNLVALAWASALVGGCSAACGTAILSALLQMEKPDQITSLNVRHTRKILIIVSSISTNAVIIVVLAIGIFSADAIARGTKHTVIHPGGTKLMATLCVLSRFLVMGGDIQLLISESKRHRRFESVLAEDDEPDYRDEPLGLVMPGEERRVGSDSPSIA